MTVKRVPGPGEEQLKKALNELGKNISLKIGWFESNKYPDGTPVAYVATIQEFGVPEKNIPMRPFMRPTVSKKKAEWGKEFSSGARAIVAGNETVNSVLDKIGLRISGDIKQAIVDVKTPKLAKATIKARARKLAKGEITKSLEKPLVETGLLLDTVTHVVGPK